MSRPWLSVLVPVYNGSATLKITLDSVVEQADGIEVILVDQGSQDQSVAIAESYSDKMDLQIVPAPDNKSWVQNTNLALSLAKAPRATLLHQDDLWRPGRAALLQEMFEQNPDAALWVHGSDYVDASGSVIGALAPSFGPRARNVERDEAVSRLLVQNTIAIPSAAFPVAAARELGGLDETLWYTADWQFWLGLAARGVTAWSSERMTAFRLHQGSLTISGSCDLDDFEAQLAAPLARNADVLPKDTRDRLLSIAEASKLLNVWLASVFHGKRRPFWPVLRAILGLGPRGLITFINDTRIVARLLPRFRLFSHKKCSE